MRNFFFGHFHLESRLRGIYSDARNRFQSIAKESVHRNKITAPEKTTSANTVYQLYCPYGHYSNIAHPAAIAIAGHLADVISFAGIGRYEFWVPGLAKDTGKRVNFLPIRIIFCLSPKPKNKNFPRGAFFFSGMGPMPRGGRAIWGATRGYRRANWTLRRPDQPYTAWHGHWFRHCPPVITGASPPPP